MGARHEPRVTSRELGTLQTISVCGKNPISPTTWIALPLRVIAAAIFRSTYAIQASSVPDGRTLTAFAACHSRSAVSLFACCWSGSWLFATTIVAIPNATIAATTHRTVFLCAIVAIYAPPCRAVNVSTLRCEATPTLIGAFLLATAPKMGPHYQNLSLGHIGKAAWHQPRWRTPAAAWLQRPPRPEPRRTCDPFVAYSPRPNRRLW